MRLRTGLSCARGYKRENSRRNRSSESTCYSAPHKRYHRDSRRRQSEQTIAALASVSARSTCFSCVVGLKRPSSLRTSTTSTQAQAVAKMVKITITAAGKPKGLTKKLPLTVDLADKTTETATVEDVKKAVAAKFPKVRTRFFTSAYQKRAENAFLVVFVATKVVFGGREEGISRQGHAGTGGCRGWG